MRTIFARLIQALAISSTFFSTQVLAESLDGVSTPISVAAGQTVQLDPTDGFLADGRASLRPVWSWQERPAASVADFSASDILRPFVTVDVPGHYTARLELFDATDPDAAEPLHVTSLVLSTDSTPPVARITARGLPDAKTLTLNGARSYDVDGDAISYVWSVVDAPTDGSITIASPTSAATAVSVVGSGDFTVALTVQDETGVASSPANYTITTLAEGGPERCRINFDITYPNDGSNRVVFDLGDVSTGPALEAVIPKFDVNSGSENTFDTLKFTYQDIQYSLSKKQEFLDFAYDWEHDGDSDNDILISQNPSEKDFTITFGLGRGAVTIKNVVGNGLPRNGLVDRSADFCGLTDYFARPFTKTLPNDGSAQVTFDLGDVSNGPVKDIVIPSFDVDGGGEHTFDTLRFVFDGQQYNLSTKNQFKDFTYYIEHDGDILSDAFISPTPDIKDLTFTWGEGKGSVTIKNIVDTSGLSRSSLLNQSADFYQGGVTQSRQVVPMASVRFDQLQVGSSALDGYLSTDLDGNQLIAGYSVLVAPTGASATLNDGADGQAEFAADTVGEYLIALTASDSSGFATDQVLITNDPQSNLRPVANVAASGEAGVGTSLILSAIQSYDLNGDELTYEWSLLSAPATSVASLSTSDPVASFTPDVPGQYVAQLIVSDGMSPSVPETYFFDTEKLTPVAQAGPDALANAQGEAFLDGTTSIADVPTFSWSASGLGAQGGGSFDDTSLALTTFQLEEDGAGGYLGSVAQLVVADGAKVSAPDTVFIGAGNLRPVLAQNTALSVPAGEPLVLTGADFGGDANGDPLTFTWSILFRPISSNAVVDQTNPSIQTLSGPTLEFTPDVTGTYFVQLTASDGVLLAEPLVLSITATNTAPVAVATVTSPVFVGETADLTGTGSFDPNADALSYQWTLSSAPTGSAAMIIDPTAPLTSFVPDRKGSYVFDLVVSDFEFSSNVATATLQVPNRAPIASFVGVEDLPVGEETILSAAASSDPDSDPLSFAFAILEEPASATSTLTNLGNGDVTFLTDTNGQYEIEVSVSDGETTAIASLPVTVVGGNNAPLLGAINDLYTVELGLKLALDLTATDPDNDPLSFFASPLPLPQGITLDAQTGEIRFRPEEGLEGSYTFTVGVSDGATTSTADLNINVVPAAAGDTAVTGRVLDAVDFANGTETPLAGIPVRLADAALTTVTAADGTFFFGSLAAGGDSVLVEPSADGGPGGYASAIRQIQVTENQIRDLSPEFLLAPINDGCALVVIGENTVLSGATSGVTISIAADTIQDSTGAAYAGEVCLGTLPELFKQPGLPDTTNACRIYALDAPGAVFTQGISVTGPNVDGLPEQTALGLWRMRVDNGQFRRISVASVDTNGTTVSGSASAFSESTLFTFLPQAPRVTASADMPTGNRSLTPFEGDLSETYVLPGYRAFNRTQQVALSYHSASADPSLIVAGDVTIAENASLPETLQTRLQVSGLAVQDGTSWTPRESTSGENPALVGEEVTLRQSMAVDATGLQSGRLDYTYVTAAKYACSTVSSNYSGELYVQNETTSPFGQGWSVDELQELIENPDGTVAIIDDDDVVTFNPETSFTEFEDMTEFPAIGVQGLAIADFNGDDIPDIAYADSGTASVGIIFNYGNRQFEQGPLIPLPGVAANAVSEDLTQQYAPNLRDIGAIDANLDGLMDIVYGTQFGKRVDYLINQGGAGFVYEAGNELDVRFFRELSVADMDGDGYDDVVIGGLSNFSVNRNDKVFVDYVTPASRTLVQHVDGNPARDGLLQVLTGDVDADGSQDIVYRGGLGFSFVFNQGNRQFDYFDPELACVSANNLGNYAALGDFNEDGFLDYINSRNYVSRFSCPNNKSPITSLDIYLNDGGRSFPTLGKIDLNVTGRIFPLDTDGDDHLDVVRSSAETITVYKGNGDGTFLPPETGILSHGLDFAEPFDIDGDGALDLISAQRFSVTIDFSKPSEGDALIAGSGEFSTLEKQPDGSWIRRYKDGNTVEFNAEGLQTAEVETQGNRREMTYDPEGRLLSIIDQVDGATTFTYDAVGRLALIIYPDGRETVFEFENEQLVTITEPDSDTVSFSYDENGRLISTTNQNGNTSTYAYDATGRMAGADLPDGSSIQNQVASSLGLVDLLGNATSSPRPYVAPEDRVTTVTDRKGQITEVVVNRFGSTTQITDPLGRVTKMDRNDDDLVTRVERPSDALGGANRVDTLAYDSLANVTRMTEAQGSATERTMTYEYEPVFSKVTQMTDGDGFVTAYEYDAFGEVTKITDPEGGERLFTYTPEGKALTRSDENGNTTSFTYAANQNLDQITYADNSVTQMTYDAAGNATTIAEASGAPEERQVQRTYDSDNRVLTVEVIAADGTQIDGITTYAYDGVGNLSSVVDETGLVTSMTYDALERLTEVNDPAEGLIRRVYNAAGEVTQHINGADEAHNYVYDEVSRLIQTTDPEGFIKSFAYDVRDNIATVTDGRGGLTAFAYDPLDRMTTRTNPINQTMARAYDLRDNLTVLTREDGATETATYDGLARRMQVVTPDNTLTYAYDPRSNLTEAADNDSRVTFTYDARNRLASTTTDGSFGLQPEVTLSYTYDALDRRLTMSDSLGGVTQYAYDPEDRLTKLTAPWGTEYDFGYDGYGRRTSLTSTSGRVSTMGYTNGLLSALSHAQNGVPLTDLEYRYDVDGQLTAIDDLLEPSKSKGIAYDDLNRLVQVAEGIPVASGGTQLPIEDYAYDEEGNRTASHLSAIYASNDHNQLLEDDTYTYAYDEKGNRISKTAKVGGSIETYSYDSQNRLVGYASDTTTASYAYDAMERRIGKTVDGEGVAYVYDMSTDDPLAMDDITLEFEAGPLPTLKRRWAHSNAVDEPVGFEEYAASGPAGSGTERLMYADRQGSILWVTDPVSDAVVAAYEYKGFGELTQTQGTLVQPYGFTGREYDKETGLNYYRSRQYDPRIGLFLQKDPIEFSSGTFALYSYVSNGPFYGSDPSGLTASIESRALVTGAAAATIGTAYQSGLFGAIIDLGRDIGIVLSEITPGAWPFSMSEAGPTAEPPDGKDPCKGLRRQLRNHIKKFEDWQSNPFAADNLGLLTGSPVLDMMRIVGRSIELRHQVMNWTNLVKKCEQEHGM